MNAVTAKDIAEELEFVIDGPTYTAAIAKMLDAAADTQDPSAGYPVCEWFAPFDSAAYESVIENYMYDGTSGAPLVLIPIKDPKISTHSALFAIADRAPSACDTARQARSVGPTRSDYRVNIGGPRKCEGLAVWVLQMDTIEQPWPEDPRP